MATKTKSYGTTIGYSAAGAIYTDLADVISITPPRAKAAAVNVTHLSSADMVKEYLGSWKEPGEATLTLYFTKAQFATVLGLFYSGTDDYYWKITLPMISGETVAGTFLFRGHLAGVNLDEINIDDDGKILCPVEVQATRKPTFTAGT